jgi:hypothetical protein
VLALTFAGARVAATLMDIGPLSMAPNQENGDTCLANDVGPSSKQ